MVLLERFSSVRIQNQEAIGPDLGEVEHLRDRTCDAIERPLANAFSFQPVVLDEANDRSLIGHGMVNRVLQGPGRDHNQRLPRAISAATQSVRIARINARQSNAAASAGVCSSQRIRRASGLVDDGGHLVVVPAVGIVVQDHDGGAAPTILLLQEVEQCHNELLLIQWIRVASMTILIGWSLNETHRREVALSDCAVKIQHIVLVIGRTIVPDFSEVLGPGVIKVRGRGPIVEEGVVRYLVARGSRQTGRAS